MAVSSFTALLNTISAYWHIAGVIFIVIVLLVVPDNHQSLGYVFGETVNASGFGNADDELLEPDLLVRVRDRPADGAVHDHGLRRLGAHGRGDDSGLADGRGRHVHVRRRLRRLRVHPARRRDAGDPEHRRCRREPRLPRSLDLDRVDEPELGRGAALHLRRRAVLLRHGVADVGVADAVRVLARRRRSRPPALAAGRQEPRAAAVVRGDRGPVWPQ